MYKRNEIVLKREKEKQMVSKMIEIYCKKNHGKNCGDDLCLECRELRDYAFMRADKCPFMETKTFCANCKVHCYKPEMKEKIKKVMKFSGPRMILHNPVMAISHVIETIKHKRQLQGEI